MVRDEQAVGHPTDLSADATLRDLELHAACVAADRPMRDVRDLLERRPQWPGVLIEGQDGPRSISRDGFHAAVTRPYVWEVFARRPIERMLNALELDPCIQPDDTPIHVALEAALGRSPAHAFEPIIVRGSGQELRLLDVQRLLLAHSRVLRELNQEIRRQKDVAELANAAKSAFLANMSHEFRTPMNGILGLTEIVLEGERDSERREHLQLVRSSGRWLLDLLNDVLDISKLEAGKVELLDELFEPRQLLEGVVRLLRTQAEAKGLSLEARIAASVPRWLVGDEGRLRQVLINLVSNAIKFTESGFVRIEADGESTPQGACSLRLAVCDSGIGIPQEKQARVFEPFEQADSSTTRRYGGTGLGLSICRAIVDQMGGELTLQSAAGQGATFRFEVLLRPGHEAETPLDTEADPLPPAAGQDDGPTGAADLGGAPRVLVAEDNRVNQRVVRLQLERLGCDVTVVNNGAEAVEAALGGRFDLVLMDVQMPQVDGMEATRRIRDSEAGQAIPIVALTAHALVGDRDRCTDAGMDGYLTKPISIDQLRDALARWVAGGRPVG